MRYFEIVKVVVGIADDGHPINADGDGRAAGMSGAILNVYIRTGAGGIGAVGYSESIGGMITKSNDG